MIDERRPVWPWIMALLIGLPVLYVASFGPACWLADHRLLPGDVAWHGYRPLAVFLAEFCPDRICDSVTDYGRWGSGDAGGYPLALMLVGQERIRVAFQNRAGQ